MQQRGFSLAETLVALAILMLAAAAVGPHLKAYSQQAHLVGAAQTFQGAFRRARSMAIRSSVYHAIVFDGDGNEAQFALYRDGNGNGVRRADIRAGVDPLVERHVPVTGPVSDVSVAIRPGLPAIPPDTGTLSGDAIRFGSSNILSFSPLGTATPGTFYILGRNGRQAAVRVTGGSSRVRTMIWDGGRWSER